MKLFLCVILVSKAPGTTIWFLFLFISYEVASMLYYSIDIKLFLTSSNNETFASHKLCPLLLVKFCTVTCSELR